LFRKRDIFVG